MEDFFYMLILTPKVHNHNNRIMAKKKVTTSPPAEHIQQQFDTMWPIKNRRGLSAVQHSYSLALPVTNEHCLLASNGVSHKMIFVLAPGGTQHH